MKKLQFSPLLLLVLVVFFISSCQKESANELTPDLQEPQQRVQITELDPSFLDTELTHEQVTQLGFDFDKDMFDQLSVSICDYKPTSFASESCGAVSRSKEENISSADRNDCCSTGSEACNTPIPNSRFRLFGCFDWIFEATDHRLTRKWYINGNFIVGGAQSVRIQRGCNFYDPYALYDSNGQVIGYLCIGPSALGECPATVTVETEWRYFFPATGTYMYCGFNSTDYNYPGLPWICDDQ